MSVHHFSRHCPVPHNKRINHLSHEKAFCSWFSFLVCINYEALLRLGCSRCCQRLCYKLRSSNRAYYDDIEYCHQPLNIYADDHIDDVPNFFNYILPLTRLFLPRTFRENRHNLSCVFLPLPPCFDEITSSFWNCERLNTSQSTSAYVCKDPTVKTVCSIPFKQKRMACADERAYGIVTHWCRRAVVGVVRTLVHI